MMKEKGYISIDATLRFLINYCKINMI